MCVSNTDMVRKILSLSDQELHELATRLTNIGLRDLESTSLLGFKGYDKKMHPEMTWEKQMDIVETLTGLGRKSKEMSDNLDEVNKRQFPQGEEHEWETYWCDVCDDEHERWVGKGKPPRPSNWYEVVEGAYRRLFNYEIADERSKGWIGYNVSR